MSESPSEYYRIPMSSEDQAVVRARVAASEAWVTAEKLARWKALDRFATPGPWHYDAAPTPRDGINAMTEADGEFCAEARTGWPACIAEIERLRALLAESKDRCRLYRDERETVGPCGLVEYVP